MELSTFRPTLKYDLLYINRKKNLHGTIFYTQDTLAI